jgi:hypothetical protein
MADAEIFRAHRLLLAHKLLTQKMLTKTESLRTKKITQEAQFYSRS